MRRVHCGIDHCPVTVNGVVHYILAASLCVRAYMVCPCAGAFPNAYLQGGSWVRRDAFDELRKANITNLARADGNSVELLVRRLFVV